MTDISLPRDTPNIWLFQWENAYNWYAIAFRDTFVSGKSNWLSPPSKKPIVVWIAPYIPLWETWPICRKKNVLLLLLFFLTRRWNNNPDQTIFVTVTLIHSHFSALGSFCFCTAALNSACERFFRSDRSISNSLHGPSFRDPLNIFYPLVNCPITMERSTMV